MEKWKFHFPSAWNSPWKKCGSFGFHSSLSACPIHLDMSESEPEVSEARGREILTLLRKLLDDEVHPTLRDVGVSGAEAQCLAKQGLIVLGDTRSWGNAGNIAFEDRYVIARISDSALVWLAEAELSASPPIHQMQIVPPAESKFVKICRWLGNKLWEILAAIVAAVVAGWFLWKHHW